MNMVKFCLVIGVISFFCQGCTTASSPGSREQDKAKLVDMGNGICQQSNGLMWQVERTGVFASAQEAGDYVDNLNLGNHNDWRLPSKDELYDLCYIFDMKLEGQCPLNLKGSYWSSNGKTQAGAWESYPLCGGSDFQYFKSKSGRVRAVRP